MGDLKEAPAVGCNVPLLVFPHYIDFRNGIAAASDSINLE